MRTVFAALAVTLACIPISFAQSQKVELFPGPDALKWGPVPANLPKGAKIAVLSGDPSKADPFVLRLMMPPNYQVPAHHHPTTENVTILSGSFHAGMGDKLNKNKAQEFKPGGFVSMPAQMNHYAFATEETVVQIEGKGPFAITYVNPADDPSKGM